MKLVVALCVGAGVALGFLGQWQLVHEHDLQAGLIVWGFAAFWFAYGLMRARALAVSGSMSDSGVMTRDHRIPLGIEIALLAAVLGVGIFFRLYRITSIPPGLNHDAAWEGMYAIRITQGIDYAPYVNAAWGRETMFFYIVAFFQILMGPTKLALQMGSIAVGIATLGAMYIFVRRLFDAQTALVATFLLGVSGWHLTLSKVGWREILVPLFIPLIFYFVVRAVEERRLRDFVIGGILLGLSLDTYDAARVLPFTAAAFLAIEATRDRSLITRNYLKLAAFVVAAALAFSPLGWYAFNHWVEYTGRGRYLWIGSQIQSAGSLEPLFINLKSAALLFNYRANGNDFFVREPLLDLPLSVFFPLGLALAVTRVRERAYSLLLLILGLDLMVGILSTPNGNRNFGAVIPVMALSAIFLVQAWRWLTAAFPAARHGFSAALIGVLLASGWVSYDTYLGANRRMQKGFFPAATRVGEYMHDIPDDDQIYTAAGNWPTDAVKYLSYRGHGDPFTPRFRYFNRTYDVLNVKPLEATDTVFIIEAADSGLAVFDALKQRYPLAATDELHYPAGHVIANVLTVPAGATPVAGAGLVYPPGFAERDAQRRSDLARVSEALLKYEEEHHTFPQTEGQAHTACGSPTDELCQFADEVGAGALLDPRKDTGRYGYWYASDGLSFTLFATLEGPVGEDETCPPDLTLPDKPNVYCLHRASETRIAIPTLTPIGGSIGTPAPIRLGTATPTPVRDGG